MTDTRLPSAADRPDTEPVLAAGRLAGIVAAVVLAAGGLLRSLGLVLPVDVQEIATRASDVVIAGGVLWAVVGPWLTARLRARDKVTPLVDARDEHGLPLYSADEIDRLVARARAQALDQARDELHAQLELDRLGQADDPGRHAGDQVS